MGYIGTKPSAVPLTSADIADGIITSAKIADGTIVNADINASAGVVLTKLASTGTLTVDNIQFPATQVASANANNLDDYEEGTFTPTAYGASTVGTTTYLNQNGFYTKIGNQVTVFIFLNVSALTGTGTLYVGGLPFTTKSAGGYQGTFPLLVGGLNWSGGTCIVGYYANSYDFLRFYGMTDDASYTGQSCVNEAFDMYITATYLV